MSHSLIGADRGTHTKIMKVALAGAVSVVTLAGAAWRAADNVQATHARAGDPVVMVGKPVLSANAGTPVIR